MLLHQFDQSLHVFPQLKHFIAEINNSLRKEWRVWRIDKIIHFEIRNLSSDAFLLHQNVKTNFIFIS